MSIFVFSSSNLTNIWAGIGAGLWAVSNSQYDSTNKGRATKAKNMKIGSCGILYCVETQSLTTPFVVFSNPDPMRVVANVWPEEWVLPFKIHPLGTPSKQLHKDKAMEVLPTPTVLNERNFSKVVNIQPITVFSPSRLTEADWEVLITHLADGVAPEAPVLGFS